MASANERGVTEVLNMTKQATDTINNLRTKLQTNKFKRNLSIHVKHTKFSNSGYKTMKAEKK